MTVIWIVLLGLVVGAVLGGLGGGGAILTVPCRLKLGDVLPTWRGRVSYS